jgi:predicted nuclease of predicted toxin-antitoxin system
VKLLFDENLSRKLVARLSELYPGSAHVADFDLLERPDGEIWDFARQGGFVIVTTDADFYELAAALDPPPKVVWLGAGPIPPGMPNLYSGDSAPSRPSASCCSPSVNQRARRAKS